MMVSYSPSPFLVDVDQARAEQSVVRNLLCRCVVASNGDSGNGEAVEIAGACWEVGVEGNDRNVVGVDVGDVGGDWDILLVDIVESEVLVPVVVLGRDSAVAQSPKVDAEAKGLVL